jgi:hypothetical protein
MNRKAANLEVHATGLGPASVLGESVSRRVLIFDCHSRMGSRGRVDLQLEMLQQGPVQLE